MLQLLPLLVVSVAADFKFSWPLKRMSVVPGDLFLGAFFAVHETGGKFECGKLEEESLYQLESLLYSIDKINENPDILPGVKLGIIAVDCCDSAYHTLEESVSFVRGFIARENNRRSSQQYTCSDSSAPVYVNGSFDKVVGIIGGRSSSISIQLADLLRNFRIPQVSFKSNALQLSDKNIYEYFFRTVPPLDHQVRAILETLRHFGWTYISIVFSDSAYGSQGFESFEQQSGEEFCYSTQQRVTVERFTNDDYDEVLMNLMKKNATVIVIFGEQQLARNMMSAATRKGVYERFVWLGSEAWGKREYVSNGGNERVLEGAISVSYVTQPPIGFIEYFMNLTPSSAKDRNPFFYEYWEGHLQCRMEGFPDTPFNQKHTRFCSKDERIPNELYLQAMPSAQLVRDAAHVFARALHEFQKENCGDTFCKELEHITGTQLKQFVQKIHFEDEYGNTFQFDKNGDALPKYDIINYQRIKGTNEYKWVTVGKYTETKENVPILQLHRDTMIFKHDKPQFPESLCSAPCLPGEAKIVVDQDLCCWHCLNCTEYEIVEKETKCTECSLGSVPNENKTACVELPIKRMNFRNPWAIGAISFSVLGIMCCIFVAIVFYIYWDTPIIKASGRDLSGFLLLGISLLFTTTFAVVAKPAASSCGSVRFFLGFYYTLCYSAIVIKTRRIALIFDQSLRNECRKVRYTRPKSQMMMIAALLSVEAVITAIWLVQDPPAATFLYPSREERILICKGADSASYLVGLIYPFILMGFCTVYAFKTRKCPDGFNEARLIAFTNYTTCIIWLAFIPTFTINSSNTIRTITLSTLFNLSGSVQLLCLFMPKVYIALFQPERNTKESVMCYYQRTGSSETPVKIQEVK